CSRRARQHKPDAPARGPLAGAFGSGRRAGEGRCCWFYSTGNEKNPRRVKARVGEEVRRAISRGRWASIGRGGGQPGGRRGGGGRVPPSGLQEELRIVFGVVRA